MSLSYLLLLEALSGDRKPCAAFCLDNSRKKNLPLGTTRSGGDMHLRYIPLLHSSTYSHSLGQSRFPAPWRLSHTYCMAMSESESEFKSLGSKFDESELEHAHVHVCCNASFRRTMTSFRHFPLDGPSLVLRVVNAVLTTALALCVRLLRPLRLPRFPRCRSAHSMTIINQSINQEIHRAKPVHSMVYYASDHTTIEDI